MTGRDLVIYLSHVYKGNWNKIYDAIKRKEYVDPEEVKKVEEALTCKAITPFDEDYPECLKTIFMPPFVIYYYGDISYLKDYNKCIGVVGSRKNSDYGANTTYNIVKGLKEYVIVSGMAKGIDTIAHKASIASGGRTVAVLGCGIDRCYPQENIELYKEIKEHHLLISEYPGDTEPVKDQFPQRNRLIAALSNTIVVGEAGHRSGTFITVADGLTAGRTICCVPYPANVNSGCNRLIKEGAILVETAQDVIDELPNAPRQNQTKKS